MPSIFISYRRNDAGGYAARVHERLVGYFGPATCFFDLESIRHNEDFADRIDRALTTCDVVIAIVGPDWISIKDEQGRLRLQDPRDFVRREVAAALRKGSGTLFPVLVGGARMPDSEKDKDVLPEDLRPFCRENAIAIHEDDFDVDFAKLTGEIEAFLGRKYPWWHYRRKLAIASASRPRFGLVLLVVVVLTLGLSEYLKGESWTRSDALGVFLIFLLIGTAIWWAWGLVHRRKE